MMRVVTKSPLDSKLQVVKCARDVVAGKNTCLYFEMMEGNLIVVTEV